MKIYHLHILSTGEHQYSKSLALLVEYNKTLLPHYITVCKKLQESDIIQTDCFIIHKGTMLTKPGRNLAKPRSKKTF